MKIDIYTSAKNGEKYVSIPKGKKLADIVFPETIDTDLLTLSPFKTRLEIDVEKDHVALDQRDIIQQIEAKGYATHGAKITLSLGGS